MSFKDNATSGNILKNINKKALGLNYPPKNTNYIYIYAIVFLKQILAAFPPPLPQLWHPGQVDLVALNRCSSAIQM